ncbi:MAG: helix-turn-helix domain-containing protein [Halobacteriota archaeon]
MIQQAATRTTVPSGLRSPNAKLVYLYLSTHGGATISELQAGLEMKKLSLYSILATLRDRGYVRQEAEQYVVC